MKSIEQGEADSDRNFRIRKQVNILLCSLIFILGVTSTIYKAIYEGGFLTCFREMTVCGTVFSSLTAFAYVFISLYEIRHRRELKSDWLYTLRLSSCTTEFLILVVVLIGYLPFVPADPTIMRYDMMNMHVLIPVFTVCSFVFNDPPIGKLTFRKHVDSLSFLALYTGGQLICILNGIYPAQEVAYFFLDVMHQPVWFTCFAVLVIYGLGYILGGLFARLNRKGYYFRFGGYSDRERKH